MPVFKQFINMNKKKLIKLLTLKFIHRIFTMNDKESQKLAYSKKNEFTQEDTWLADVAKALSHPARIRILKILTEMNVCMCGDIVELLPLSQSTVSQHLKELKRVGLIHGDIEGPKVCYCVNNENLQEAKKELDLLFSQVCNCQRMVILSQLARL